MYLVVLAVPLTGLITFFSLKTLLRQQISQTLLDVPNSRSSHTQPTPKVGGVAIMLGILVGAICLYQTTPWLIVSMAILLTVISFIDDKHSLQAHYRLIAHLLATGLVVLATFSGNALLGLIIIVATVWLTNLYNFMDGLDGIAGGMTCFGFGAYAVAAYLNNNLDFALLNMCVVIASLVFLIFNFPPAKVFMGDTGSIPLGFLAATFGLYAYSKDIWSWWFPIMVFSPFIADATVTLFKRLLRREKIWTAHKEHYYQRLAQMGWGHLYTTLFAYSLMLIGCVLAIYLLLQSLIMQLSVILVWALVFAGSMYVFDH